MSSELLAPQSLDSLTQLLIGLKVLQPAELQSCRNVLGRNSTALDLLQQLEKRQLLTPYQIKCIERGETDMLVLGGCKLLYQNASGSFARLYRACEVETGRPIGLKVLRDRWSKDPDMVHLFQREGELGKRLKHPNIVPVFEVGMAGKQHYITMEFVEGGNLRDFLKIRKKLAPEEALRYGLHIARALDAALALGVTHRDMKTTNVLMSSQGIAKLIDFGLATNDAPAGRHDKTELAQALEYSTLERNTNSVPNDPRSDLFFLGTILYELLTGELPYPRTRSRDERKNFSRYRDIPAITTIDPLLPLPATRIVQRLLQISPSQRFQTPAELMEEIAQAMKELGHPLPPAPGSGKLSGETKILMCVESRKSRQDLLRDYFTKKGYRVLLLPDAGRAITRLKSTSPKGVILFGDALGNQVVDDFQQTLKAAEGKQIAVVLVIAEDQLELQQRLKGQHPDSAVLRQPISLRELRKTMEQVMKSYDPSC